MKNDNLVLTEAHLHTAEVSTCAYASATEIPNAYQKVGFKNLIVTDHWNEWTLSQFRGTQKEKLKCWLSGYEMVCEAAAELDMNVFLGMEMNCDGIEDYLIYGLTPEFLFDNQTLYNQPLKRVFKIVDEAGLLLFQAHPFRSYLKVQSEEYMHGVEVFNGNPSHDSHNDRALEFAKEHNLLQSAGTDFHKMENAGTGGIYIPENVKTNRELVKCLRKQPKLYQQPIPSLR